LLDLVTGATLRTFIPRIAEGVFDVVTLFTEDDRHVVYYHSGKKSVRVFRVSDGKQVGAVSVMDVKQVGAVSVMASR